MMRRWLVVFLAGAAAVLSFDALRAQALASGAVHHQALAALWAVVIDGMAAAGVLGVRTDRRDGRAWVMLLLAFACSIAFQVVAPPAWLARAVPPVALLLAIVVLELPRTRRNGEQPAGTPAEAEEPGALPGALPVLAAAWNEHGEALSGTTLARTLTEHGLETTDRDARRLLALLRADPAPAPVNNGQGGTNE
ncbi:MAG TPA: DUF2637 domain-containing protein [Actinomycetes bacterium]|jgi:uncharacterized membrane protein|nr:DUF2637 domain-containing protein [Actinomycetes bacterium]